MAERLDDGIHAGDDVVHRGRWPRGDRRGTGAGRGDELVWFGAAGRHQWGGHGAPVAVAGHGTAQASLWPGGCGGRRDTRVGDPAAIAIPITKTSLSTAS